MVAARIFLANLQDYYLIELKPLCSKVAAEAAVQLSFLVFSPSEVMEGALEHSQPAAVVASKVHCR